MFVTERGEKNLQENSLHLVSQKKKITFENEKKKLFPVFFSLFLFPFFLVFTDGTWKNDLCKIFLTSSQVINTNEETISIRLGWITL